jgi:hypothetical protein
MMLAQCEAATRAGLCIEAGSLAHRGMQATGSDAQLLGAPRQHPY